MDLPWPRTQGPAGPGFRAGDSAVAGSAACVQTAGPGPHEVPKAANQPSSRHHFRKSVVTLMLVAFWVLDALREMLCIRGLIQPSGEP